MQQVVSKAVKSLNQNIYTKIKKMVPKIRI